ncbi:hypothetical protein [Peribacillus frigoritolerans]|uniref:hypothetical protein n=1 Tax=Peribacillus frigoritolerans TaxID=450367 RepID=UPI0038050FE4
MYKLPLPWRYYLARILNCEGYIDEKKQKGYGEKKQFVKLMEQAGKKAGGKIVKVKVK